MSLRVAYGFGLGVVGEIRERQPQPCTKDKLKYYT